jgi:MFS family permease
MSPARQTPVTLILAIGLFLTGIAAAAVAPYRAIAAIDGLHFSTVDFALMLSVSSLGGAVASVALGYLSDKTGDRRVLVLGSALLGALAYGLIYLVPSPVAYVVALCVIMPFGGTLFSQTFAYARTYLDQRGHQRAEFMISALRSLFSLSWVVAPPLAGWLAARGSVFDVFLVAALALSTCATLYAALFLLPGTRVGPASPDYAQTSAAPSPGARGVRAHTLVGLVGVALFRTGLVVHLTTFPLVVTTDFHGSLTDVGAAASLAALIEVPFMLLWGYVAGRVPKVAIIIGNGLVFAAYLFAMGFAHTMLDVLILQGFYALSTAALLSLTISYLQEAIKGRVGLSTSLIDVMAVIAGFASAGLFALFTTAQSYIPIFFIAGLLAVGGSGLLTLSSLMQRGAKRSVAVRPDPS